MNLKNVIQGIMLGVVFGASVQGMQQQPAAATAPAQESRVSRFFGAVGDRALGYAAQLNTRARLVPDDRVQAVLVGALCAVALVEVVRKPAHVALLVALALAAERLSRNA